METLRKLLDAECGYRMKDETMDRFLELMTDVKLKRGKALISYGDICNSVYILKQGIVRNSYFDGFNERTFTFALPGTLLISHYAFTKGLPSFNQYEACCDSVVMKIPKAKFIGLANESHDFAQWMMYMSLEQLFFLEKKREVMNGTARERFKALIENRPEIIETVSSKIIASYIGITQSYLSTLKKELAKK
jgi:CRP-like cAMP-binding protein